MSKTRMLAVWSVSPHMMPLPDGETKLRWQWLTSKYPGCRCDIPSIVYQFSWRPNIWSEMYAPATENLAYLKAVTRENDFYKYIYFKQRIESASWTDKEGMWTLSVKDLESGITFEDKVNVWCEFNGPVR